MEFTKHSLQRYVERIENKYGTDRDIFIAQNEERIKERLEKLFDSAEEIYQGKLRDNGPAKILFNKNGWVVITDLNKSKIITVYKVDLKMGDDLNKEFWERALSKVEEYKEHKLNFEIELQEKHEDIDKEIKSNTSKINELKTAITDLEKTNQILNDIKQVGQANIIMFETRIKDTIEALVSDRIF